MDPTRAREAPAPKYSLLLHCLTPLVLHCACNASLLEPSQLSTGPSPACLPFLCTPPAESMSSFMNYALGNPDVWFVTISEVSREQRAGTTCGGWVQPATAWDCAAMRPPPPCHAPTCLPARLPASPCLCRCWTG